MALGIVALDMRKFCRLSKGRIVPVTVSHPFVNRRVTRSNVTNVGLEVLDVHCVEANCGGEKSHICFCDLGAVVVGTWRG